MMKFYSKRNQVELVDGTVVKTFLRESDFRRELAVYRQLAKLRSVQIPEIIETDEDRLIIYLSYLEGPTVLEVLEKLESDCQRQQAVAVLLATLSWLDLFYELSGDPERIMGDVNLRNFIWYDEMVFGIDFESSGNGDRLLEKAELLARYLLYNPVESDFKKEVLQEIKETMEFSDRFEKMIESEMTAIILRRGKGS